MKQEVRYSVWAVIVDEYDSIIECCTDREEINYVRRQNKGSRVGWWEAAEVVDEEGNTNLPYSGRTKKDAIARLKEEFKDYKLVEC